MRSGCLGFFVRISVVVVAAIVAAASLALIASFAVSALGQPSGISGLVGTAIALGAGFGFFLAGRGIWREMTEKRQGNGRDGDAGR